MGITDFIHANSERFLDIKKFLPTPSELFLFIISFAIIMIIATLIHYTFIDKQVKKYSRCNNFTNNDNVSIYKIKGIALINNTQKDKKEKKDIYEITYNFNTKMYIIEQLSPTGKAVNTIQIPVYNLRTYNPENIEKIFQSEYDFSTDDIMYEGHPDLVRFMQFGNTDFFEKKLF